MNKIFLDKGLEDPRTVTAQTHIDKSIDMEKIAHAIAPLLKSNRLKVDQIDYWEINEAFAAQVLAVIEALKDKDYCKQEMGLRSAVGEIPLDRLNIHGGGVSIGHPVGASGARIVLHLARILEQKNAQTGIASLCIGGGQGGAMLLKRGDA